MFKNKKFLAIIAARSGSKSIKDKNLSIINGRTLLYWIVKKALKSKYLDKKNKVVSNPGGTATVYKKEKLKLMLQETPIFNHCHDVCIDQDKNLYVCQWNANKTYPIKLERI